MKKAVYGWQGVPRRQAKSGPGCAWALAHLSLGIAPTSEPEPGRASRPKVAYHLLLRSLRAVRIAVTHLKGCTASGTRTTKNSSPWEGQWNNPPPPQGELFFCTDTASTTKSEKFNPFFCGEKGSDFLLFGKLNSGTIFH